jgi:cell fate (sporulation/competence/biofilm development) regulator YlbF (YheA/YmcA/DUF963 family)
MICIHRRAVVYWGVGTAGQKPAARPEYIIKYMQTMTEETAITQKTKELCQAILDQPELQAVRRRIDEFMENGKSKGQYDELVAKGNALQEKQRNALPLTDEEIGDFERHRDGVLKDPVTRGFLEAQEELKAIQDSIRNYVSKTIELGRLPTEDEVSECGCGHGCGCHH